MLDAFIHNVLHYLGGTSALHFYILLLLHRGDGNCYGGSIVKY